MKTDKQVQQDVIDELGWEPSVNAEHIGVEVSDGKSDIEAALKRRATNDPRKISVEVQGSNVTLTGSVHSWSERDLARDSAWGSPGVRNVVDKMTVSYS
jgi:osmotically-inducible protein OsmY